jgi:hypothetical protein
VSTFVWTCAPLVSTDVTAGAEVESAVAAAGEGAADVSAAWAVAPPPSVAPCDSVRTGAWNSTDQVRESMAPLVGKPF